MEEGYLKIRTFIGNDALPIRGVQINITNSNNELVRSVISNSSGSSEIIALPAPPKNLSLSYTKDGALPYAVYNVEIQAPNYAPIIFTGVQILEGTTALLNVRMLPAPINMYQEDKIVDIKIPPININN